MLDLMARSAPARKSRLSHRSLAAAVVVCLLLAGAGFVFWRYTPRIPVYISADFLSQQQRSQSLLPPESPAVDAVRLFVETQGSRRLELNLSNSKGDKETSAEQVMDFLSRPSPKLVFGPTPTNAVASLLPKLKSAPPLPSDAFLLNQATEDPRLHSATPALSSHFSPEHYLSGVVPVVLSRMPRPGRAHILRFNGRDFFHLLSRVARQELLKAGIPTGPDIEFGPWPMQELDLAWRKRDVKPGDWVIIIDQPGSGRRLERLWHLPSFRSATIIFANGVHESRDRLLGQESFPAWHVLRWHPWFHYKEHGKISNCDFVRKFWDRHGYMPDYRAAYIFALMEKIEGLGFRNPFLNGGPERSPPVPTILGRWKWAADGQLAGRKPLLLYNGHEKAELYLRPEVGEPCESSFAQLRRTVIHRLAE